MSKRLYMETTAISSTRTAGQIAEILATAGASQILTDFADGTITALSFKMPRGSSDLPFRLPVRTQAICELLRRRRTRVRDVRAIERQAERIAWRQIYRWVQAQLALIETGMVTAEEVFLPYLQNTAGQTIYECIAAGDFKALPAPVKGKSDE